MQDAQVTKSLITTFTFVHRKNYLSGLLILLRKILSGIPSVSNSLDPDQVQSFVGPGPKVMKLEYSLKLKIKHNDWLLVIKSIGII